MEAAIYSQIYEEIDDTGSFIATIPKNHLTVSKDGSGTGTVTSLPEGIDCGTDCTGTYNQGTRVTLKAEPEAGSAFEGWSDGGCSGINNCLITLNVNKQVTAKFVPVNPITSIWQKITKKNFEIYFTSSNDGGYSWTKGSLKKGKGKAQNTTFAANGENIYIVWQIAGKKIYETYFMMSNDAGKNWAERRLTSTKGKLLNLALAVNGENIYVVWQGAAKKNYETYLMMSTDAGYTWEIPKKIATAKGKSLNLALAVEKENIFIAWHVAAKKNYKTHIMILNISMDNVLILGDPKIIATTKGKPLKLAPAIHEENIYVVWQGAVKKNYETYFMMSDDGENWLPTPEKIAKKKGNSQNLALAVNRENIYAVWQIASKKNYEIYFMKSNNYGANWAAPEKLLKKKGKSHNLDIQVDGKNLFILWIDGNNNIHLLKSFDGGEIWTTAP